MRVLACLLLVLATGCFGASRQERRYFVLHMGPTGTGLGAIIPGLVRVRNLDSESTYDKFQIVVRRNPYELNYRETDVWAVKPNRMVSDSLARRLQEYGLFSGVTRELGEQRPDYSLGGDLHAIELYDSGDRLYAHLSMTLTSPVRKFARV
ncbi:MAG: ABC-type transport auxiliary lipoprotein family protein, partial [Myxococcota bacterium]